MKNAKKVGFMDELELEYDDFINEPIKKVGTKSPLRTAKKLPAQG